jgi:hypothetical protein
VSGVNEIYGAAHAYLQGMHLRFLSSAVSCIEADQSRLGEVIRLNVSVFKGTTPWFSEASLTSFWCAGSVAANTQAGSASKASNGSNMVAAEESAWWVVLAVRDSWQSGYRSAHAKNRSAMFATWRDPD